MNVLFRIYRKVRIVVVMASDLVLSGEVMFNNGVVFGSYSYQNQFNVGKLQNCGSTGCRF